MVTIDEILDPSTVQLGFSEPLHDYPIGHTSPEWWDWDGGQLGGKPSWLNPRDIPKTPLQCLLCHQGLRFLCQLYAPADYISCHAFHRSFYIFACPDCPDPEGTVRVLRTQLEEQNEFYPPCNDDNQQFTSEGSVINPWIKHLPEFHQIQLCQVCGQRGSGHCPIQGLDFCGRAHQKEYKKYSTNQDSNTQSPFFLPSVYTISELVVEEEPNPKDGQEEERDALVLDHDDPDLDLEQDDLDDAAGKTRKQDPVTTDFMTRVARAQDQCLRYYPQWGGRNPQTTQTGGVDEMDENHDPLLWIVSQPIPTFIPDCSYCGSKRMCEFQLMPQMLYHLLEGHRKVNEASSKNAKSHKVSESTKMALSLAAEICETAPKHQIPPALKDCHDNTILSIQKSLLDTKEDMDWGVIAVYTCTSSCGSSQSECLDSDLGAYREEYAWKQPPP
jgi:pre-rRNA-processing protein TSR4